MIFKRVLLAFSFTLHPPLPSYRIFSPPNFSIQRIYNKLPLLPTIVRDKWNCICLQFKRKRFFRIISYIFDTWLIIILEARQFHFESLYRLSVHQSVGEWTIGNICSFDSIDFASNTIIRSNKFVPFLALFWPQFDDRKIFRVESCETATLQIWKILSERTIRKSSFFTRSDI